MKDLLGKIGLFLLNFLANNESVHNYLREQAKKTSIVYDDIGAEVAISGIKAANNILNRK